MPTLIAQALTPFVAPALAWAGVALVSVPVAIHLLSRWRRKPEPWGAMRFLIEAYRKQKRRMRFEQWLLLLLRCLIILMLGLAVARPRLVGALGQWFGGLDSRGRVVHIVIDDAMSTGVSDGPGVTRFDRLIAKAEAVVDALEPGDRATIWRAGRPAGAVIAEPTADRAVLHDALKQMRPGYSRSDLATALELISDSMEASKAEPDHSVTVLLGDFTRSARYIEHSADPDNRASGGGALIVSRPFPGVDNIQVLSVTPRRRVVWVDGLTGGGISAEVLVARYAEELPEASASLTVALIDAGGRSLASLRRRVYFPAGQGVTSVSVDLPVEAVLSKLDAQAGEILTIRAQLESVTGGLTPDDQAHTAVELRRRLRVAVVDEQVGVSLDPDAGLSPGQWVTLALNPTGIGQTGAIETTPVTAAGLSNPSSLESLDAVMLMRPDRVFNQDWRRLASFAESGGLIWVFTPPNEGSAPWISTMIESFDPGWRMGLEPVDTANSDAGRRVVTDPLKVEPLERLAADWQALIRPVRVYRGLPVTAPGADAWITLHPSVQMRDETGGIEDSARDEREVLLAHHSIGRGSLIFLSTSVDTRWTNLPTKPLFVPLIHETLRGVLGLRSRPGIVQAVAGDRPTLGLAWSGLSELDRLDVSGDFISVGFETKLERPGWTSGQAGVQLVEPVSLPGVYQAGSDAGPRRLIVDADPKAGDTRQIDEEAFAHWLDGLGEWRWLDDEDPGTSLMRSGEVADIGWAMLWGVLGLVLLETVVARFLSHANVGPGRSLTGRIWRAAIRLRSGEKPVAGGRGRAA